jgi:rubrerythrin/uncharacterized damage-inducible protein DinB
MTTSPEELQRLFTCSSMGSVAYHAYAVRARHERRFNIARLFEALSASRAARADVAFHKSGAVTSTVQNLERALAGIEPEATVVGRITGVSEMSRALLGRAAMAMREDRDLRANELGDLYVCLRCGELREGAIGSACPVCGAVPESHRAFRGIEAMGTLGPHSVMSFLEHTERGLRTLCADLTDEQLGQQIAPGQPSVKELVGHLVDMDAVFRERAWLILETDRPQLPQAHPPKLDSAAVYRTRATDEILSAYHDSRRQTLLLLRGLTSAAWHRTGSHEIYGQITLLHQGNWMVSHEKSHLVDLAQLRHDILTAGGGSCVDGALTSVVVTGENEGV